MEYNKLIAVTGLPGLFEMIASKNDGAIVRSLDDKTTKFVSSRVHNFSHLETIEVYTSNENVNLVDVFQAMKADKTALPDKKDNAAIRSYFEKVFPEMDFERVFASDMKKMVRWYEILDQNNIEIKLTEMSDEDETADSGKTAASGSDQEEPAAEKKKPAAKKKAPEDTETETAGKKAVPAAKKESAPARKTAAKEATSKEVTPKAKETGSAESKKETPEAKKTASAKETTSKSKAAPKAEPAEPAKKKAAAKKKGGE